MRITPPWSKQDKKCDFPSGWSIIEETDTREWGQARHADTTKPSRLDKFEVGSVKDFRTGFKDMNDRCNKHGLQVRAENRLEP